MSQMKVITNDRGERLVVSYSDKLTRPLLTVELFVKWYALYLVNMDESVVTVIFPTVDGISPPYVDHVPNPASVQAYADAMGYDMDPMGMELITGRWQIDVLDERKSR